jgi:hypothetical protein
MDEENQINLQNVDVFASNLKKERIGYYGLSTDPTKITNLSSSQISTALKNKISPTMSNSSLSLQDFASSYEKANIIGGAASGLSGIISGLVGGRARRREQRQAKEQYNQMMADYKNFQFENAYLNVENPFEDLRVSTEAAEFQAQQQQQGLAQTLDALRAGGGGVGAAALAQSLANVQAQQTQRIAADISRQEVANEQLAAQAEFKRQSKIAAGEMAVQGQEFERTETMLGMAQQRKAAADAARQQATASLIGGIGSLAGAAIGAAGLPGGIGSLFGGGV